MPQMTKLLEEALRKVELLPQEEQDAIASQIVETLQDEAVWKERLQGDPAKLHRLADDAIRETRSGQTTLLEELKNIDTLSS